MGSTSGRRSMRFDKPVIRALGEIALRVNDLDGMQRFYQGVIGLALMRRFPNAAFFRIADGHAGHTQVLALFDRSEQLAGRRVSAERSTVDHIAFAVDREDLEREKRRLEEHGLAVETAEHAWVSWRSIYVKDPEGNLVELVCYDPSL